MIKCVTIKISRIDFRKRHISKVMCLLSLNKPVKYRNGISTHVITNFNPDASTNEIPIHVVY